MSRPWHRFLALYSVQFLQLLDFMSITPVGAVLVGQSKIASSTISYSLSLYSFAAIVGSVFLGRIGLRSPKQTLLVLLVVFSASQAALIFGVSNLLFLVAKAIGGLTGGLMGSIAYSQLSSIEAGARTGLWNGRIQTAQSLVTILGIPLCILVVSNFGTSFHFAFMTAWTAVTLLNFRNSDFVSTSVKALSPINKDLICANVDVILTGFVCYFAAFVFVSHMANYLVNGLRVTPAEISLSYTISGLITLGLAGAIGKAAEKVSAKLMLGISSLLILIPQLIFYGADSSTSLLYVAVPMYLLISNARAIYQRAIILEKAKNDSFTLHLMNNVAVRSGILLSGLLLGVLSSYQNEVAPTFQAANIVSIWIGLATALALFAVHFLKSRETAWVKQ